MSLTNPFGDVTITDPQAMRALAHPVRLAALTALQRNGPMTATQLSAHVGATPSVTSWHLRHLATFGLVTDADPGEVPADRRQRYWKAVARGFTVDSSASEESQTARRALATQLEQTARQQTDRWWAETEPELDHPWRRLSGVANTGVRLTADELERLQHDMDELLAVYTRRADEDTPADARRVRILRSYLPEAR
ncbi:transcriptional regulator [Actinoplanes philippinensis]|uniref:DNA-binding transcriptional regulator, ArsR family n=1 Tax=Actinoplanes philippinensis TaxID=35752 RepID=A0A1I2E954_9ACTN|nr:ArsR family transcriptional regulator [Actinoplanes philippinensis]GIE77211.1 transcriptional regulator [Actinoplanes philippinensis]SFE88800.1 DNA-binding transcriptional regulator, ArsR family [Actinoplanes philippinensis]